MNIEEDRLRTFTEWPETARVNPSRLARGGFFYTGRGTEAQCFLCGARISDWEFGDQVMVRHRQADPDCPFVQDPSSTCNVPMIESSEINQPNALQHAYPPSTEAGPSREPRASQNPRVEYGTYEKRLSSFRNWPAYSAVSPESLARAGFYYLQQEDMVECIYCRGVMRMWERGDDPDIEHRIGFPDCDFYIARESTSALQTVEKEGLTNVKLLPGSTSDLQKLGIQKHTAPKQPKHATYEARLRTFQRWPENLRQTPEMVATAGFYYVGSEDQVRCFHCDGGLHNWETDDDPWTEHARWFPKCGYVSIVRGQDFIKQCIDNRPPLDPSILRGVPDDDNGDEHADSNVSQPINISSHSRRQTFVDPELEEFLRCPPVRILRDVPEDREAEDHQAPDVIEEMNSNATAPRQAIASERNDLHPASILHTVPENRQGDIDYISAIPQGINSHPTARRSTVSDLDVQQLLNSPPAAIALQLGLSVGRVKTALRQRLEIFGIPYTDIDQLIQHVRHIHLDEESNGLETAGDAQVSELVNFLNRIVEVENRSRPSPSSSSNLRNVAAIINGDNRQKHKSSKTNDKLDKTENGTLSLEEENRRLKEARLCKICMDKEISVVFLPCGHLATCVHCAPSLTDCPMCRQEIRATVRTFLA